MLRERKREIDKWGVERGQGLLEIAIILPILLLLLFGLVETGFGLRNYLLVCNANREAARFAARGRFSDDDIGARLISAGGIVRLGGADVPFLRTQGIDPNTGIIITHIQLDEQGNVITATRWISGVIASGGTMRPVVVENSAISMTLITNRHKAAQQQINSIRTANGFETMFEHVVVVETFFAHRLTLGRGLFPDPWVMYAQTEMRLVTERERGRGVIGE